MKRRNESVEGGKAEKRHVTRVPVFFFFLFFWGRDFAGSGIGGCGECGQLHDIRPRCECFIFLMVMVQLFQVCDNAFCRIRGVESYGWQFRDFGRARTHKPSGPTTRQPVGCRTEFGSTPVVRQHPKVRPRWNLSHESAVLARLDPR
jgi:hypothetical protein